MPKAPLPDGLRGNPHEVLCLNCPANRPPADARHARPPRPGGRITGLPRGAAKPLRLLAAFQEAEPYLGLPVHAYKLVAWLVKQAQPQDWEEGSRPIAWPSARHQAEFLGLSPARAKQLNRALFEAGVFVMRDNEQGKRYGRRDPETKRIIEAFGFELSPLARRHDEFGRIAALS
ncbi:MAG: helix-turn-helix domain-containing protein [Stellaceae bacterium]